MKHWAVTLLLCVGTAIASSAATWLWMRPHVQVPTAEDGPSVPFTAFLSEVHDGRVVEIHIRDRIYSYRLRDPNDGRSAQRHAIGPSPDPAMIEQLRPTDPALPPPKIVFAKEL